MPASWRNILLIIGSTVGAGIFSLPHVLRDIGLLPYILLLLISGYICFRVNSYYLAVVSRVKGRHQLSGYISRVLGAGWGRISLFLHVFSTFGALIAFTIIGGTFLSSFLGISQSLGSQLFFVAAGSVILIAGKKIDSFDSVFSVVKVAMFVIVLIVVAASPAHIQPEAVPLLSGVPLGSLGIFLFASAGFTVIPELTRERRGASTLLAAQSIIVILYLIFAAALFGFARGNGYLFPTPAASLIFYITGFVSVFTAYMILAWVSKDMLTQDMKLSDKLATGLTIGIPFVSVLSQFGTFTGVLGFTGGVFMSGTGILLCRAYAAAYPGSHRWENRIVQLLLALVILIEISSVFVFRQ